MGVKHYRKKPKVVEAIQYDDSNYFEIYSWVDGNGGLAHSAYMMPPDNYTIFFLKTPEGDVTVRPGDWVIRGTAGEFYPCKPDIFADVYDEVIE